MVSKKNPAHPKEFVLSYVKSNPVGPNLPFNPKNGSFGISLNFQWEKG